MFGKQLSGDAQLSHARFQEARSETTPNAGTPVNFEVSEMKVASQRLGDTWEVDLEESS